MRLMLARLWRWLINAPDPDVWRKERKRRRDWACDRACRTRLSIEDTLCIIDYVDGDEKLAQLMLDLTVSYGLGRAATILRAMLDTRNANG